MDEANIKIKERIGAVATDPLRVLGLKAIFGEVMQLEIVQLSVPGALDDDGLSLVLIDAECTNHLLELIATFRQVRPRIKLIILGSKDDPEYIQHVIGAGAKGYLMLTAPEAEIRMAVEIVRDGSVWAPRKVLSRLLDEPRDGAKPTGARPRFTAREIQVLRLLGAGQPNREIALALNIDEGTVKAHIGRLMRKVGVSNRIALTVHPHTQDLG
jgi:DNA-binding NarL/FixJ family response regulator